MIDPAIEGLASELIEYSKILFKNNPAYTLDLSISTLPTLDILISSYKVPKKLNDSEKNILRGISAYIGILTYNTWSATSPKPQIKLKMLTSPDIDIVIEVVPKYSSSEENSSEDFKNNSYAILNIYKNLIKIIETKNSTYTFFDSFSLDTSVNNQIITNFTKGVLFLNSPYIEGNWFNLQSNKNENISKIIEKLALEISSHNEIRFNYNEILKNPKFYYKNIIYPPHGFDEPYLGIKSIISIIELILESELSKKEIEILAKNFLQMTDNSYSILGFILGVAFEINELDSILKMYAASRHHSIQAYVPTINIAKNFLNSTKFKSQVKDSYNKLQYNYQFGLIPYLLELPSENLFYSLPKLILNTLNISNINNIKNCLKTYKSLDAPDISLFVKLHNDYINCLSEDNYVVEYSNINQINDIKNQKKSYLKIIIESSLKNSQFKNALLHLKEYVLELIELEKKDFLGANEMHFILFSFVRSFSQEDFDDKKTISEIILLIYNKLPMLIFPELHALLLDYCIINKISTTKLNEEYMYNINRAYWSPLTPFI